MIDADLWGANTPNTKSKLAKAQAKRDKLHVKMEKLQRDLILNNGDIAKLTELLTFESKLKKPKLLIVNEWAISEFTNQPIKDENDF